MELKTQRLLLRPLVSDDWKAVHEYASDVENTRYMTFLPNDTEEETRDFVAWAAGEWQKEKPETCEFAILLQGKLIGACSVAISEDRREGEMGWILNKRYWGQGYMTEAALAVRNFAIRELGLMRLIATCDSRNQASWRVMEKLSFRLEKEYEGRVYPKTGEKACERLYSLTVSD